MLISPYSAIVTVSDKPPPKNPPIFGIHPDELERGSPKPEHGLFIASLGLPDPWLLYEEDQRSGTTVGKRALFSALLDAGVLRRWYSFGPEAQSNHEFHSQTLVKQGQLRPGPLGWRVSLSALEPLLSYGYIHALLGLDTVSEFHQVARSLASGPLVPLVNLALGVTRRLDSLLPLLSSPTYRCDRILLPSHSAHQTLSEQLAALSAAFDRPAFAGTLEVLPLGVSLTPPAVTRADARARMGWRDEEIVILAHGRVDRRRKFDPIPFLLAFDRLQKRVPNLPLRLVIAGDGDLLFAMRLDQVSTALGREQSIEIRSGYAASEKEDLLAGADIALALADSFERQHAISALEAMVAGLPVVAADWDGLKEVVVHEQTGFLIPTTFLPPGPKTDAVISLAKEHAPPNFEASHVVIDLAMWEMVMVELVSRPELRSKLGAAGRARVVEHFDPAKSGYRLAQILVQAVVEANSVARQAPNQRSFASAQWARFFGHYSTQTISSDTHIARGRVAPAELPGLVREILGMPPEMNAPDLLSAMYGLLATPKKLNQFTHELLTMLPVLDEEAITRTLVRGAKFGVFQISQTTQVTEQSGVTQTKARL